MTTEFRYAAAGDKNNDQVTRCKICSSNGFPHEPVKFSKVEGRILSDGTKEVLGYELIDYITDTPHQHKSQQIVEEQRFYKGWNLEVFLK